MQEIEGEGECKRTKDGKFERSWCARFHKILHYIFKFDVVHVTFVARCEQAKAHATSITVVLVLFKRLQVVGHDLGIFLDLLGVGFVQLVESIYSQP